MTYQEKFEISKDNCEYFSKQFDILITGFRDNSDNRHICFKNSLPNFNGLVYCLDTCENSDHLHYKIEDRNGNELENTSNKLLIPDLEKLLKERKFEGARICIDITTLKQGVLFLLIRIFIKTIKPSQLFAAYAEPLTYNKRQSINIGDTEEYDLYDRVVGSLRGVPGFIKHKSSKPILLIAPMGFDTQRLQTIHENLKPKKIIPIVGFPSFAPGWNLTAIKMNYRVLRSSNSFDLVEPCESASPFEMFNLLKEIYHRHISEYDIYISPLGTRPHCLGTALFASHNPSVYLIYDFPVEKKFRSKDVLKINFYHLSKYIN